ncbi:NUDIX hydrolase [Corynebacterium sp. sy017]|uniref:NUDIX domain-containing protein n=1 Tax=unclassified Corynebacterium TaxID=2624378 RepID=UPI001186B535|nr:MULTISPECIES: NUDIX hydrolase [unclassified Corynebacterium]MBP3087557.1 NUDIX hydrolase [Corynebacterium sp. sy017]TSD92135.1 NUDIX hydrolase [Corynebacterium sp. SY003]
MAFEFSVISSDLLLETPIFAVRNDCVTMPEGTTSYRQVVEHFGGAAIIAYDKATESIALVEQYRHSVARRLLEVPAGLIDNAHASAYECAQWELREEIGAEAKTWNVLIDLMTSPGFCDEAVRVFFATDLSRVPRPHVTEEEADAEIVWIPLKQAVQLILEGKIYNAISVSAILAAYYALENRCELSEPTSAFAVQPTRLASRRREQGYDDMKQSGVLVLPEKKKAIVSDS